MVDSQSAVREIQGAASGVLPSTHPENTAMMKRMIVVGLLAAAPMTAHAGLGFTATLGSIENGIGNDDEGPVFSPQNAYPTIDYKSGPSLVQINALDLINSFTAEDYLVLGGNYYYQTQRGKVSENIAGSFQLGGSLDYVQSNSDRTDITALFGVRMGAQSTKKMGFGIYVVPEIGLNLASGDLAPDANIQLAVGGQVQVSTWFGGK